MGEKVFHPDLQKDSYKKINYKKKKIKSQDLIDRISILDTWKLAFSVSVKNTGMPEGVLRAKHARYGLSKAQYFEISKRFDAISTTLRPFIMRDFFFLRLQNGVFCFVFFRISVLRPRKKTREDRAGSSRNDSDHCRREEVPESVSRLSAGRSCNALGPTTSTLARKKK